MKVRPKQLVDILVAAINARAPVLVKGKPGAGKSDIVEQACAKAGAHLIISHPAVEDPTDTKGLPWPAKDQDHATFLPFGELARVLAATELTVWFWDDFGQAPPSVQAAKMQLLLARRVNGHKLPDCVVILAATNDRSHKAAVSGMLEPVKSRFETIIELENTIDDWVEWALDHNVDPRVIGFLRARPDLLHDFHPTADLENSPCPRTWFFASKWLQRPLARGAVLPVLAGNIGEGVASEFVSHMDLIDQLPDPEEVLRNPEGVALPPSTKPGTMYALCCALAFRTTVVNSPAVLKFIERLNREHKGEFAAALYNDMLRRCPDVRSTPEWPAFARGPFGDLIERVYKQAA